MQCLQRIYYIIYITQNTICLTVKFLVKLSTQLQNLMALRRLIVQTYNYYACKKRNVFVYNVGILNFVIIINIQNKIKYIYSRDVMCTQKHRISKS